MPFRDSAQPPAPHGPDTLNFPQRPSQCSPNFIGSPSSTAEWEERRSAMALASSSGPEWKMRESWERPGGAAEGSLRAALGGQDPCRFELGGLRPQSSDQFQGMFFTDTIPASSFPASPGKRPLMLLQSPPRMGKRRTQGSHLLKACYVSGAGLDTLQSFANLVLQTL